MGLMISNILARWNVTVKEEVRICMVGLEQTGKTSILFKLKKGEVVHTIPSEGFYVDTLYYKSITLAVFTVGGHQPNLRPLWRNYFMNVRGFIFVIDSTDTERFAEARGEIEFMLSNDKSRNVPILVFANKQDLANPMTALQMSEQLGFDKLCGRKWHIQPICAGESGGIIAGLDWLSQNMFKT